jgi:hypothetical protein
MLYAKMFSYGVLGKDSPALSVPVGGSNRTFGVPLPQYLEIARANPSDESVKPDRVNRMKITPILPK